MFCRVCGNQVRDNTELCPKCGCRPMNGSEYCNKCGAKTRQEQVMCVKCQTLLKSAVNSSIIAPTIDKKHISECLEYEKRVKEDYRRSIKIIKFVCFALIALSILFVLIVLLRPAPDNIPKFEDADFVLRYTDGFVSSYRTSNAPKEVQDYWNSNNTLLGLSAIGLFISFLAFLFYLFFKLIYKSCSKKIKHYEKMLDS